MTPQMASSSITTVQISHTIRPKNTAANGLATPAAAGDYQWRCERVRYVDRNTAISTSLI